MTKVVELQNQQLAFHVDLEDLKPGTNYKFSYKLIKKGEDGKVLETRENGAFKTFETDP